MGSRGRCGREGLFVSCPGVADTKREDRKQETKKQKRDQEQERGNNAGLWASSYRVRGFVPTATAQAARAAEIERPLVEEAVFVQPASVRTDEAAENQKKKKKKKKKKKQK